MRFLIYAALAAAASYPAVAATSSTPSLTQERQLQRQLFMTPGDPVALAQLADHYAATGRPERARRLYRALLRTEDVQLERSAGEPIGSRALAKAALARLDAAKATRLAGR